MSADSVPHAGSAPVRRRAREAEQLAVRDRRARPDHVLYAHQATTLHGPAPSVWRTGSEPRFRSARPRL